MFFVMAISLYTSRMVLQTLGVEDFGIFNIVGGIVVMFSFLNTSMSVSVQRFMSFEIGKGDESALQKVFSTSINIHLCIALVILLLVNTIGFYFLYTYLNIPPERIEAARWVLFFSTFSFAFTVIQAPFNATIIAHEKMNVYAYCSIVEVSLKLLIVYLLCIVAVDKLKLYSFMIFVVTIVITMIYICYCYFSFPKCRYTYSFSKLMFYNILGFSSWNLLTASSLVIASQGGNMLLNIFFGPTVNASRGIAYQVSSAVNSFIYNLQSAINPQIIKLYSSGNYKDMLELVYRGSRYSFFLLFLVSFPIFLQTPAILKIWLGVVPEYTVTFCRLVIINAWVDSFAGYVSIAIQAIGMIKKYNLFISILLMLNLPISYLFLKNGLGANMVFITSIFISVIGLAFRLFLFSRLLRKSIIKNFIMNVFIKVFLVLSFVVLIIGSLYFFSDNSFLRNPLVCIGVTILIILVAVYLMGTNKNERKFICGKISCFVGKK